MAASGFTPISLYNSTTASAVPLNTNLANGELAINITDGLLYYKDNAGVVRIIASRDTASGSFTNLAYTGTLTGGTGVVNLGSGQFYKDAGGNVGIGTASPQSKLHVSNSGAAGFEFFTNYPGGGVGTYIQSFNRSSSVYVDTAYYANSHTFWAQGDRMVITSAGNVGIGTSSPAYPLDVNGNGRFGSSSTGGGVFVGNNLNSGLGSITAPVGSAVVTISNLAGAFPIAFNTDNAERMRITGSGDVGIGTTSPAARLDVAGTARFPGTSSLLATILTNAAEVATISATAATGTIPYYPSTQSVLFYTSNASANWTVNLTFSAGTTMNTAMSTGQALTVAFLVTQGGTAYYNNAVQVDGTTSGVTTRWLGGTAPTSGNASSVDVYTYTVIKTGSATFTVLASQTKFA
jgi:hypothetical protein